ncbi:hypothetical protein [Brevundimonas denitrificans]|uniref:hypothetical protein n=1 Tax=Brevundimonas denitrificans TaxID=1443434 RepID=UPI00223B6DA9|nr:hypothetical protein [Brevundimonas denitrificans]
MSALGRLSLPSDAATDREGTLAALHRAFADIIRATADESLRVSALVGLAEAACRLADSRIQAVQDTSSLSHLDDTLAMIAESLDAGSPLALELSGGLLARRAVLGPAEAAAARSGPRSWRPGDRTSPRSISPSSWRPQGRSPGAIGGPRPNGLWATGLRRWCRPAA